MPKDVIGEQLSISEEERNLVKKPTDREMEFGKVMDIIEGARDIFLSTEMPIEEVISRIQADLVKLLPRPGPTPAGTMDAIAGTRPPGLGMLGK